MSDKMLIDQDDCHHPIKSRAPFYRPPSSYTGSYGRIEWVEEVTGVQCLGCGKVEKA